MAESRGRRGRDAALGMVGVVAFGSFGAAAGVLPARADDPTTYPSWTDVQQAKQNAAAAEAEAQRITGIVTHLQAQADAAGRTAQIAGERSLQAQEAEAQAAAAHAQLAAAAGRAADVAKVARMRAGLLAAGLARTAGGGTAANLLLDEQGAGDLLDRLAAAAQLSAQTSIIYNDAVSTQRQAQALDAQASAAAAELQQRSEAAAKALATAQSAATAAEAAVAGEQQHQQRLLAQLADLRGVSTRVAAQYVEGVQAKQDAEEAAREQRAAAAQSASSSSASSGTGSSGSGSSGTGSSGTGSSGTGSSGSSGSSGDSSGTSSSSSSSSGTSQSSGVTTSAPNSALAASAVAFARDQIGDAYAYGGAGPSTWDCSGLTMEAYASVGIAIGGHSATAQYNLAKSQGQLVPYASAAVGDLIFYTDGGGDMYHVAIYSGAGMMIEAPYPGAKVREVPVRAVDRVPYVARPTA